MNSRLIRRYIVGILLAISGTCIIAQDNVPLGIHYQAVARDNFGKEIVNRKISVRFSLITGNPLGTVVYQELHLDVITSRYGVFSLVIGRGTPTGLTQFNELSQVTWETALHFLKVEVKFENDFMDMGTMQFLAVPYALFAKRSLEPGPAGPTGPAGAQGLQGPQGEKGDAASDDQTLSVVNVDGSDYLAIEGGNQVKISNIERDGDPLNEIQDLVINSDKIKVTKNAFAAEWDLSPYRQTLNWDPSTSILNISGASSPITLSDLKNDADADPVNEIQDIALNGNLLTVSKNSSSAGIDLSKYLDDKDNQQVTFNPSDYTLSLTNSPPVDLIALKNDADADPVNEIQDIALNGNLLTVSKNSSSAGVDLSKYLDDKDNQQITFNPSDNTLSLSNSPPVDLTSLKNDSDADPANEIQTLTLANNILNISGATSPVNLGGFMDNTDSQTLSYNESTTIKALTISNGNSVTIDNMVAFRAKKTASETKTSFMTDYDFVAGVSDYTEGGGYNIETGEFTAPVSGIYIFNLSYNATGSGDSRVLKIQYIHGSTTELEIINSGITGGLSFTRSITLKLNVGDKIKPIINVGTGFDTGTGTFSGFKVY